MMPRFQPLSFVCIALFFVLGGCEETPQDPVARLKVDAPHWELVHGTMIPLSFEWEMLLPLGNEDAPHVFVHLLNSAGEVVLTADHLFPSSWAEGQKTDKQIHLYHSVLMPPLPAGDYRLTVGLYELQGRRWPLADLPEVDEFEYEVAQIHVPAKSASPRYKFSEAWQKVTPGTNRQVVARRWLPGEGSIQVNPNQESGTLWLVLMPLQESDDKRLVLEEGAEEMAIAVSSSCSDLVFDFKGFSSHEASFPIQAEMGECELNIRPNFHLVDIDTFARSSLSLEQLAWQP